MDIKKYTWIPLSLMNYKTFCNYYNTHQNEFEVIIKNKNALILKDKYLDEYFYLNNQEEVFVKVEIIAELKYKHNCLIENIDDLHIVSIFKGEIEDENGNLKYLWFKEKI